MKALKKVFFILIILHGLQYYSIAQHRCGADSYSEQLMQDSSFLEKWVYYSRMNKSANVERTSGTINIPVAVHFSGQVTNNNMCCLIEASLKQVEVLNQDFRAQNADISRYHEISIFCPTNFPMSSLFAGFDINFYLANINHPPSSGLTDGQYAITVQTESPDYAPDWAGYLNVFVKDVVYNPNPGGTPLLVGGYALVGGVTMIETGLGIVVDADQFGGPDISCFSGSPINSSSTQNLGRTTTHEVGHFFGLGHVFAGCNNGDGVSDTPDQDVSNNGNPTWFASPHDPCHTTAQNSCGTKDFFMNFMDYSDDKSAVMFTQGQGIRMMNNLQNVNWASNKQNNQLCDDRYVCEDIIVTTNTVLIKNLVSSNVIVQGNATLTIQNKNIKFTPGKGIIVKNGGRLILQGSTIDVCDPTQSWTGIKIESGAFCDTDEAFLKNCANGVEALANSTLRINNLNIDGKSNTSGIGLKLDGNVNTDFIYNLNIKDFNTGIQTFSSTKVHEFNHGAIKNTTNAISSVLSTIIVNDYNINFTNNAIMLSGSAGSLILNSNIIYRQQGIAISESPFTTVQNSSISNRDWVYGIENLNEKPAIGIVLSDGCYINNNYNIASTNNAIAVRGSNWVSIQNNNITTDFSLNGQLTGGPVNLQFGNGHIVSQNFISADQSEFGINSNWAGNTTIMNNTIYNSGYQKNFRTAAIKATGNLDEVINQNIVTGYRRTGVLVQNTTGNQYFCNEMNSVFDEAQDILFNSEQQTIKANTFDGNGFDIKIKSEIGTQATLHPNDPSIITENWGNVFLGGNAEADQFVIDRSQFPFNPDFSNHSPSNPNPASGWFTPNNVTAFLDCNGLVIGDNFIFGNDPDKICAYWNYLKSIRNSKPELFFVKLVHLLKYSKIKSGFILPDCVTFDPVIQSLCGVTKIVDVSIALTKVSESNVNNSTIASLQNQYINEISDEGKAAVREQMSVEMTNMVAQLDYERNADSLRLDSLFNELNTIDCTSVIVEKWKDIMKMYINFIKQGHVKESDKAALESYSMNCSDLYGEAIHLARSMANSYNRTYYDIYDGCIENTESREVRQSNNLDMSIVPNPTNGMVYLTISDKYTGNIDVFNINGQKVFSHYVTDSYSIQLDLASEQVGMYFIKATAQDGMTKNFKIILIK